MNSRMLVGLAGALLAACSNGGADPRPASSPPLPTGRSGYEAGALLRLEEVSPEEHPGLANVFRLEAGDGKAGERASAAFAAVRERCDSCHGGYRNE